jgi:hypothetical protein
MSGQAATPHEIAAATIVAGALGGTWRQRDGADDTAGLHDYDIENLRSGGYVALEVTTAIDSASVSLATAAFGTRGKERRWPAPDLANNWVFSIENSPTDVKVVVREMLPILAVLERHGETNVDTHTDPRWRPEAATAAPEVNEALRAMYERGVSSAHNLQSRSAPEPEVFVSIGGGAWADTDRVNKLVEERAQPKLEKLGKAHDAVARHLFVWFDGTQPDAELAIETRPPPSSPPKVGPEIDVVWIATPPLDRPRRLWRVRPPAGWEELPAPVI